MKYHEIISALTEEPLLITPAAHAGLYQLFEEHRTLSAEEFRAKREGTDFCGNAIEVPQMRVENGVAIIPIGGPIGSGFGKFEKGAGAVDVSDVAGEIEEAEDDPRVESILFNIDSPGGMVSGTPELADRILDCTKPTYAFTAGDMASAAYWIGCSVSMGIYATKTANLGSIGVYMPFLDSSEAMAKEGLKVDVITSGKLKGMGVPGTSLTAEQRDFLQTRILEIANMFSSHVMTQRPGAHVEDFDGRVLMGESARKRGLADAIVASIYDVPAWGAS